MKIETCILPRRDGTVIVKLDEVKYVFKADDQGIMVAEVDNEEHLKAILLRGDDFMPADEADFAAADALISRNARPAEEPDADVGENVVGDVEDLDDDDPENADAAPIEEPTSAVAAKGPAKAAKAKK